MRDKVKRFLSILMTALMLVNLLPVGALAEGMKLDSNSVQSRASKKSANVYVYVKVTGDKAGLTINPSGWYTIGKSENVPGMGTPYWSMHGSHSFSDVGVSYKTVLKTNFTRWTDNQKIDLDQITWTEFYVDNGADDYVKAGTCTWHMNGTIDIKHLPSVYTIKYVDYDTKELIHSYEKTGLMGQTPEKVTAPDSLQENLYSFYFVNGHPKEQTVDFTKDKGELTFYYKKNTANYTVNYYLEGTKEKVKPSTTGTAALRDTVYPPTEVTGYTLVLGQVTSLTIGKDENKNVLNLYYTKNNYEYTVNYFYDNVEDVEKRVKGSAPYQDTITYEDKAGKGYQLERVEPDTGSLTIGTNPDDNVINVYYKSRTTHVSYGIEGPGDLSYTTNPDNKDQDTVRVTTGDITRGGNVQDDDFVLVTAVPKKEGYVVNWYRMNGQGENDTLVASGQTLTVAAAKAHLKKDSDGLYTSTVYHAKIVPNTGLTATVTYKVADGQEAYGKVDPAGEYTILQATGELVVDGKVKSGEYVPSSTATANTGYKFVGRYKSGAKKPIQINANLEGKDNLNQDAKTNLYQATVFEARFEPDAGAKVPVTYEAENGTLEGTTSQEAQIVTGDGLTDVTAATPNKGYKFDGWYVVDKNDNETRISGLDPAEKLDAEAAKKNLNKDGNLYAATTFIARFVPDTKQSAKVIYTTDGNGTLWGGPAIKQITQFVQIVTGEVVREDGSVVGDKLTTIPTYPKDGYEFDRWIRVFPEKTIEGAGSALTDEKARPNLNQENGLYQKTEFRAIFKPRTDLSYTVNYYWNGTTEKVTESKTIGGKMFGEEMTESPIGVEGYTPASTESQTITLGTGKNEINFYYYKNVELTANSRTLTYDGYEHGVSGFTGAPEEADFSTIKVGANGTDANTYPANFAEDTVGTFDKTEKYIVTKTTDGQLVIEKRKVTLTSEGGSKVYDGTALTKPEVQIEGSFVDGEVLGIVAQGTVTDVSDGEVTNTIFFNPGANFKESNYNIVQNEGKLWITPRQVTLTSETASKEYDGNPLTKPDVTVTGDGFVKGEVTDIKAKGEVTHVSEGEVTNTITYTPVDGKFDADNYTITKNEGKLSITPLDGVVVEIEGRTKTVTYNGEEHTAWQYDVVSISDPLYETAPGEFPNFWNKNAKKAKGTDAGTYPMGWVAEDFENTNTNFSNVTFVVTDGNLVINKRPVTLTSASDKKVYDGNALTKKEVTVGGDGFAKNEGATYNVTGTQTNVGESKNTFSYTLNEGTKADNYTIEKTEGTLKVTPVTDKVTVTITGLNKTVTYDGEEHSVFGYDATPSNKLYNPKEDMQFEGFDEDMTAKGTDAGTHTMGLTADQFHNKDNGNFTNVTFVVEKDGYVKINPRPVTLTSGSAERVYNGKPLMNETVTVGGDGFAKDEGVTYDFTGSQTDVGESENTFTFEANEGTSAKNYSFEFKFGTLKVTPFTDKVTVTITEKSGTVTYDGGDHIVSGYKSMTANNPLYDVEDYVDETPTEAWTAKGTDVGEYPVGIVAGDFKNINTNFENVEFVVVDGALTITPAPITLQASSRSKTYDGTPLEADGYGFYEGNLALADDIESVILTGSQTLVGSSESQITEVVTKKDKNPKNYKFTFLSGLLTVTDGTGDDPVKPENVVTKTHTPKDTGYNLGETVTFTVSVTNIYNEQKEVTLEEQPGVTFVDPQGAAIGTKATKTLEPGEKWTIQATYTITLDDILADGFTNKVKANFKGGKNWNAEDYVETRDPYIELDVTKTADVDKAALGQTITYTITVDYQSNVPGKKVEVKDPLTGLETSFTTEEALEGKTVTFTTTYTVTEQDVKNGIVKNTATVKSELDNEWMPADVETPTFAPITIKPKDVTATYNGAAITGKDVEITSGKLLEGHKLSAAVIGSGVNAGSYELTLDPEKITIVDANNKDVSEMYARTILPGKLIINKRSVLITSQSATKTYDGSALTRPAVTITGDGFVPGELAKAEATGSITKVGSTPNAIRYTTTGAFNAANYSIALSVGTLTVTEKPKPEPRRTFNLTINYVYQNGKRAAASYNRGGLKNGETFDITSPVIAGYTASETVVSGTIYNRDIKVTVIYTADGVNLDDYGVPLGLGNITMNVGDCFE